MAESLNQRINAMNIDEKSKRELRAILAALLADRTAQNAKLNLDAGVTDTNFGASDTLIA